MDKLWFKLGKKENRTNILSENIYQNYMKIAWNTIDNIYSKKTPWNSSTASRQFRNLQHTFPIESLFNLVNATVFLPSVNL